jgi:hypothetical protein
MAYSYVIYTGNGANTQFSVPFPYLRREHVFVSVNRVSAAFTWVDGSTVQVTPAPASGARVEVRRTTPVDVPLVTIADGSTPVAADFNTNNLQQTYINQEQDDQIEDGIFVNNLGNLDAGGKQIKNVGNPVDAQDAVTRSYADNWFATYGEKYLGAYSSDPVSGPGGAPLQEGSLYFNTVTKRLRGYSGGSWADTAAPSDLFRWKRTAEGGETSLSASDDNGLPLAYTADLEQVYVNGALLARGVDYVAINGVSITGLAPLSAGDVVEVLSFNGFTVGITPTDVDFTALGAAAQPLADADLLLVRQGMVNKKVSAGVLRTELATTAQAAETAAEAAQAAAETAEINAEAAAVNAAGARDAAIIQAGLYATEAAGRAAVADGQAFKVQGAGDIAALEYRRVNSTTSTLLAIYPAASAVWAIREDIHDSRLADYVGAGPLQPIVTDNNDSIVLGFDGTKSMVVGAGLINEANLQEQTELEVLGSLFVSEYTGTGPVYPIVTDREGRVILGYSVSTGGLIGAGVGSAGTSAATPLAEPPIAKAYNHLLSYGQSLSIGGAAGGPPISATQPYSNVTFDGGPRAGDQVTYSYSPLKPLVEELDAGGRSETICSGAANYALTLAATEDGVTPSGHVILASAPGLGGAGINGLKKGSLQYTNVFLQHVTQAKALAVDYAAHAFCWIQGEADGNLGTTYSTYRSLLEQLQVDIEADIKAISGQTSPVYCFTYQTSSRVTINSAAVTLAQLDLAQKNAKFTLATPCYHLPFSDGTHLTPDGYKWLGAYFGRCYKQLVFDRVKPKFLNPLSATRRGNVIRVRFDVPAPPLVLDTTTLALATDFGFKVLDGASTATISSVSIDGSDAVIVLSATPTGVVKVRYGLDYLGVGLTITTGASGNLRDSSPDSITISGVSRPLYNVCPHFELTAITIGE